jgi:hypothetical protein
VVFEGLDSTFGTIAAMIVWWNRLVVDTFLSKVALEVSRSFIVEAHVILVVEEIEGAEMFSFRLILHGTSKNGIAIVDIAYKEIAMVEA